MLVQGKTVFSEPKDVSIEGHGKLYGCTQSETITSDDQWGAGHVINSGCVALGGMGA